MRINRGVEFPAEAISEYLKKDRTDDSEALQFINIDKLVSYLEQRSESVPTCFICAGTNTLEATGKPGNGIFRSWKDVWKHTNKAHRNVRLWPLSVLNAIAWATERRWTRLRTLENGAATYTSTMHLEG